MLAKFKRMWGFVSTNPVTSIVVWAGMLAALGLTIFGIVTQAGCMHIPVDRTLLVKHGHELRWDAQTMPIAVIISRKLPRAMQDAVVHAVDRWNDIADATMFLRPTIGRIRPGTPKTVWVQAYPGHDDYIGWVRHWYDKTTGIIIAAQVKLKPGDSLADMYRTVLHEFGHVLGLCHDDDIESSVMFPHMLFGRRQHVTHSDRWLIRNLYGH